MGNSSSGAYDASSFAAAVEILHSEAVDESDDAFWERIWMTSVPPEAIVEAFPRSRVRSIAAKQPMNLCTLVRQAVVQIDYIAKQSVVAGGGSAAVVETMGTQGLTCVRVLIRVLPVIFQSGRGDRADEGVRDARRSFEDTVLWRNETPQRNRGARTAKAMEGSALAHTLVAALRRICFVPNFTIDADVYKAARRLQVRRAHEREVWGAGLDAGSHDEKAASSVLLWTPGASNGTPAFTDEESLENLAGTQSQRVYDESRAEVLRLICLCCSKVLYCGERASVMELASHHEWLRASTDVDAAAKADADDEDPDGKAVRFMGCDAATSALFYSLLNTALGFDPREGVGWVGKRVPYWSAMGAESPRTALVDAALHTLLVLLDAKPKRAAVVEALDSAVVERNMWMRELILLEGEENFAWIYRNIVRLLNGVHESVNTFLPNSVRCIRCHTEVLLLLWKIIEANPAFLRYITSSEGGEDITELLLPLGYFLSRCRGHASMLGTVRVCTFLLLRLSSERAFSVSLNAQLRTRLPLPDLPPLPKKATFADLLFVVTHQAVMGGHPRLRPLHSKLVAVLSNVTAFVCDVSSVAAIKLIDLLEHYAVPLSAHAEKVEAALIASPEEKVVWPPLITVYCDCARLMFEAINNLLQYQFRGSTYIVYCTCAALRAVRALYFAHAPRTHSASLTPRTARPPRCAPLAGLLRKQESVSQLCSAVTHATLRADVALAPLMSLQVVVVTKLLAHLAPKLHWLSEDDCIAKITGANGTMVGLLPVPHPITIRRFQSNPETTEWFTTFIWSLIFVRRADLFDASEIVLFAVRTVDEAEVEESGR